MEVVDAGHIPMLAETGLLEATALLHELPHPILCKVRPERRKASLIWGDVPVVCL